MSTQINRQVDLITEHDKTRVGKARIIETFCQHGFQTRDRVPLAMGDTDKLVIDCPELEDYIEEWGNLRFELDEESYVIPADYVQPDDGDEFFIVEIVPLN